MSNNIVIEIKNPLKDSQKKYEKAVEIIEKSLGYSGAKEVSPYLAVRQLIDSSKSLVEERLLDLHNAITTRWLGLTKAATPFKLSGEIFISPSTGKPLTKVQWKKIKADITRSFAYVYGTQEDKIVKTAIALGRIVSKRSAGQILQVGLKALKIGNVMRGLETDPEYRASIQFAEESAGELIVDLSQRQYKQIHDTILNAQINRVGSRELESDLFQNFGDMNRDWRRIAETEIAMNANNGQLVAELQKPLEEDYIYMEGISTGRACPWCVDKVDGAVVVLLDAPPSGGSDRIVIGDKEFVAIWPGKSNVGRARSNWWVAVIQHPHCMCSWVRYEPGYEKERKMIDDAIAKIIEKNGKEIIP